MTENPTFYHLEYRKRLANEKLVPCERDDEALYVVHFSVQTYHLPCRMTYVRDEGESLSRFLYTIDAIIRMMRASFDRGQVYRANTIRQALDPRL